MFQVRHANTLKIDPGRSNKLFLTVNIFIFKRCIDFLGGAGFFLSDAAYLIISILVELCCQIVIRRA